MSETTLFSDHSICPCGSGKLVRACVCKSRRFVPPSVVTLPRPPVTGMKVPGCYARATLDCMPPLTGEHPLSRTVIDFLSRGKKTINTSNHLWQHGKREIDSIGISRLTSNVLCARHNSALSPLDKFARLFIEACNECLLHPLLVGEADDLHRLFNGFDLERWMLKVLCGLRAEQRIPGEELLGPWKPPDRWLSILFGKMRMPPMCGLYMPNRPKERAIAKQSIYVKPIFGRMYRLDASGLPLVSSGRPKTPVGVEISVFDLHFYLFMYPPPGNDLFYRPRLQRFGVLENPTRRAFIYLGWEERPPIFGGSRVYQRLGPVSDEEARGMAWRDHAAKSKRNRSTAMKKSKPK